MKKALTLLLLLLVVAGTTQAGVKGQLGKLIGIDSPYAAGDDELAVWLLGTPAEIDNPDMQISGRLGYRSEDTEFGAQLDAVFTSGENEHKWGMYALIFLDDAAKSYVGFMGLIAEDSLQYGPVAGTSVGGVILEYRYSEFSEKSPLGNATDRHQLFAGLRIPF